MNDVLFGAAGLLCLLLIGSVAVNTDHNFIVHKTEIVVQVKLNDVFTPKHYVEKLKKPKEVFWQIAEYR